jgi:lipocalin
MKRETINEDKRYLLILSCSKRKKRVSEVCAMKLYDGPFYKVIRKSKPKNLDILILSAKYGLISSKDTISYYDQTMTPEKAKELSTEITEKLEKIFRNRYYEEIFINLGKTYMLALEEPKNMLGGYNVYQASGQVGERLHQLKTWLQKISSENTGECHMCHI